MSDVPDSQESDTPITENSAREVEHHEDKAQKKTLFLTTLVTSGAILLCRFSGLAREIVFTSLFGATGALDAFYAAFRVPNLLRDLLAEGALSQSFTSVLAKRMKTEGVESAWSLARKIGTQIFLLMGIIVILGIVSAGPIMAFMFDKRPEDLGLATEMNRIMWPFIAFLSFAALVMGILNILGSFALPMLASGLFNVVTIALGLLFGWWVDPSFGPRALIGFSIAVTIGGLAQWLIQCPALKKAGFRFRFDFSWKDPGVTAIWGLMIPAVMASGITQLNVFINTGFALDLAEGSVTALNTAFRLWQLPVGLFGVATGMIVLPDIARLATGRDEARGAVTVKLGDAFRQIAFFALPSLVVLWFLGEEIVSIMFQRGKFDVHAVQLTGSVLQTYALGLIGYAGIKVAQPAFIALEKKWVPFNVALVAFGINFSMNYTFVKVWHKDCSWLALTTSVVTTLSFLAYYGILSRYLGGLRTWVLVKGILRISVGALVMAGICFWLKSAWLVDFTDKGLLERIILLSLGLGLAGGAYLAVAFLMKTPEMMNIYTRLKNRRSRRS